MGGVLDGGLVLDGITVKFALESLEACVLLYQLGIASRACLCCRLSPMQKRKLVELVRQANPTTVTLAIGDGANDVPMIDGAHLGVGIRGKEGMQAVQSSDIAISQFRFLRPLLLCHGRKAYRRVSYFINFYLYKNVMLAVADFLWVFQGSFSGNIAFPEWLSAGYNVFFTSWHILFVLGFDEDVSDETSNTSPDLYFVGPRRELFNGRVFATWMMYALFHGSVMWLGPSLAIAGTDYSRGDFYVLTDPNCDFWLASATSFFICILVVVLRAWLDAWRPFGKFTVVPSILSLLCFLPYAAMFYTPIGRAYQPNMENVPFQVFSKTTPLLCIVICSLIAFIPDFTEKIARHFCCPSRLDQARLRERGCTVQKGEGLLPT